MNNHAKCSTVPLSQSGTVGQQQTIKYQYFKVSHLSQHIIYKYRFVIYVLGQLGQFNYNNINTLLLSHCPKRDIVGQHQKNMNIDKMTFQIAPTLNNAINCPFIFSPVNTSLTDKF